MGVRTKKTLLKIGLVLIVLIALGLITRAIFNYTTGKRLEKLVEEMRSEGMRLTLKEFEPECDDRDNAAIIWKGAEAMISREPGEGKMLGDTIDDIFYGRAIDETNRKRLNEIIAKNQKVLQLVGEAADKPCFKYTRDWDGTIDNIEIASAVNFIHALRIYGIDAVLKAEEGQLDEAIEQCNAGMRISRKYLMEPFLISSLIAIANMKQLIVCLNRIAAEKELETYTLLNILKELDINPWRKGLVWSFQTEKILGFDNGLRMLKGDLTAIDGGFAKKIYYWLFRPVVKTRITRSLQLWADMERAAQLPYYKTKADRQMCEEKFIPNLVTVMFKEATLEAMILSAQIGIACKIYKNKNGEFPKDLLQLVPGILEKEPVDPFTGEAFVYHRQDSGFIVYSLGSNEKDNGGKGTWKVTSIVMEKDDDWAWREGVN